MALMFQVRLESPSERSFSGESAFIDPIRTITAARDRTIEFTPFS